MKRISRIFGLLAFLVLCSVTQVVAYQYEYWFDDTYTNVTRASFDSNTTSLEIDLTDKQPGLHFLSMRVQESEGQWGGISRYMFYLQSPAEAQAATISGYEYWYDTDFDNRQTVYNQTAPNALTADLNSLTPGLHFFNFRVIGATGLRGGLSRYMFYLKSPAEAQSATISGYEYWFDTDYSNRKTVYNSTAPTSLDVDVNTLSQGLHFFNFRVIGAAGQRGGLSRYMFYLDNSYSECSQVEYWIDENYADVQSVPVDANSLELSIDITGLTKGEHVLNVRGVTSDGKYATLKGIKFNAPGFPEPYAVLSEENTVLTFYYDDQKEDRSGMSVGPFSDYPDYQAWYAQRESITTAKFDPSFANCTSITSTAYWFYLCKNLSTIEHIEYLNTDNVTDMRSMFYGCSSLTSLDVKDFNTQNVTSMDGMFYECSGLTSLDLSTFKTDNVTNMSYMFEKCSGLTSLDVKDFNTENVTDMRSMFYGCSSLTSLDLTGFNTQNVTSMDAMFFECSSLTSLDLTSFNTQNVKQMGVMFHFCSSLTSLKLNTFNTEQVTDMTGMFRACSSLTSLDVSSFNTAKVEEMLNMFSGCSNLTTIYIGDEWSTASVTNGAGVFFMCLKLKGEQGTVFDEDHVDVDYAHIDGGTANPGYFTDKNTPQPYALLSEENTKLTFYYDANKRTTPNAMDVGPFDNTEAKGWYEYRNTITSVIFEPSFAECTTLTSTAYWFRDCKQLKTITGLEYLKTDNVTDMNAMFCFCSSLQSLDVTHFNTGKVTNMEAMFYECSALTELDVSHLNTSNVKNMYMMFQFCSGLTSLDVSKFNTGNVENMAQMFCRCPGLTSLDLSTFNTEKVTKMSAMFSECSALTSIKFGNFNTSAIADSYGLFNMFYGCSSLTTLDLSSFNTSTVGNMLQMFFNCEKLETIYVGDGWTTENVTNSEDMFKYCTKLKGGQGTVYDADHIDAAYAHIDGGTTNPGYFTDKNAAPVGNAEPYAVLSDENTVLTFYYDDKKTDNGGMSVGPFVTNNTSWYDYRSKIKTVRFNPTMANCETLTSTAYWFNGCNNLTTIENIEYLKTDNVQTMANMFGSCSSLTSLELGTFNTEQVTDMTGMFNGCSGLTILNVSGLNTSSVKSMNNMFANCSGLTTLDVTHFNTENVEDMNSMFYNCYGLTALKVNGLNTTKVEDMGNMFYGCSSLTGLDLSSFNTANVYYMSYMFFKCSSLTSLDLSSFNTANVEDMQNMFYGCSGLTTIFAGTHWSTASVTNSQMMFNNCVNLVGGQGTTYNGTHIDAAYAHIDGGTTNPGYFTDKNATNNIVFEDNFVKMLCVEQWDTNGDGELSYDEAAVVTNLGNVFTMKKDVKRFNELQYFTGLTSIGNQAFMKCEKLETIQLPETIKSIGERAFQGCTTIDMVDLPQSVESIGAYAFEGCTSMHEAFVPQQVQQIGKAAYANCTQLEYVMMQGQLEQIADSVFAGCSHLMWIELPGSVTKLGKYLFDGCTELHEVMMSQLTITTIPEGMFRGCANLHHVEIPASVTTFESYAFQNCSSLMEIDIPSGVTTMGQSIFAGCTNLEMVSAYMMNPFVINSNNFEEVTYNNATLRVPAGTLQAYATTEAWKRFLHIYDGTQAYAVLSNVNNVTTLTFYYDGDIAAHQNAMEIVPFTNAANRGWNSVAGNIQSVVFDASFTNNTGLTSTAYWFSGFSELTSIEGLHYVHTDNVTDMSLMFMSCSKIQELDLSSFNTAKVKNMKFMFAGSQNLTTIYVSNQWTTAGLTEGGHEMFAGCNSLVGGMGTAYTDEHFDEDYAHIDGGQANPGYLTSIDGPDIAEFEVDGILYRVRNKDNHKVTVARVMYANEERYVPSEVEYAHIHWMVTALGEKAFADLHEVAVIGVPASIDSVSVNLFDHCPHLAAIIWEPNVSLTSAAMGQFNNPNLLLYMTNTAGAPAGVTNIINMSTNTAEKIVLSDAEAGGNDFYCPEPFKAKEISYTHSYDQATKIGACQGWESIVLPFDVQTFKHETKGEIYPIASLLDEQIEYDGDKPFWLYEFTSEDEFREADKLKANIPYIISMPNDPAYWDSYILTGKVTFSATNVEVYPTHHAWSVEGDHRYFVPNFKNDEYHNPDIYLLNVGDAYDGHMPGSVFSAERENRKAHPFEAYFMMNGQHPAKRYIDIFGKDASAIREIPANSKTLKGAYDLMGRKVNSETTLPRGVYIIDGKKVMVK